MRKLSIQLGIAFAVVAAVAAGCKKQTKSDPSAADVMTAADRASAGSAVANGPVDTTPLTGVDVTKLEAKQQELFYKLAGSLSSPCGKAHSLRTSVTTDQSCKRAPFAAKYVAAMVEDGATEAEAREWYDAKYKNAKTVSITLDGVPMVGAADAPVKFVEYFDYGCPACQMAKGQIDTLVKERGKDFVIYYKMYPLEKIHPDSKSAAQAALAAHAQGKFHEMHDALFAKKTHKREETIAIAKELGLDEAKFLADFDAAAAKIKTEVAEGDGVGVEGTPTIFFNNRPYKGPLHARYMAMWIDEELAVSR